jgi:hypothetical protein
MVALPAFLVRFLPPAQDRKAAEATSPEEADVALQEAIDEA